MPSAVAGLFQIVLSILEVIYKHLGYFGSLFTFLKQHTLLQSLRLVVWHKRAGSYVDNAVGTSGDTCRLLAGHEENEKYFSIADDDEGEETEHFKMRGHYNPFDNHVKEQFQVYPPLTENELIRTHDVPADMRLKCLLSTIFCFCPTGIIALSYSLQARTEYLNGNRYAAHRKTDLARIWFKATLVVGILILSVTFLTLVFVFSLNSG